MSEPDQTMMFPIRGNGSLTRESWADNDLLADEATVDDNTAGEYPDEYPGLDRTAAFTSLGFIAAALRRGAWLWCATAVLGLVAGYGLYVKFPPAHQASASVLLTNNPDGDGTQIDTDATLAESQAVAGRVVRQLALRQSISNFIASYAVTPVGEQVLLFTVSAPSSNDAVRRTSALTTDFLGFRAHMLQAQQQLQATALDQQVNQAQQHVNSINAQINQMSARPTSSSVRARLRSLRAELVYAEAKLTAAEGNAGATLASTQTITASMVKGSEILDPAAPVPTSFRRGKGYYLAVGLFLGLALGLCIVIVRALVSDRLRLRNDIADAMAAPVRLSVGRIGARRRLPGRGRRSTSRTRRMRRVVAHLDSVVTRNPSGPADLAVVAVDNARAAARAVVSLAMSRAGRGEQVVVADLSSGAGLARLLGVKGRGVHAVSAKGTDLVIAVPDRDDIAPRGPLTGGTPGGQARQADPALAAAYAAADLLLTLATLEPAYGADHLATWATSAVAVVTAGRSSAVRVRAAGEMIRLAGVRLLSVILLGADSRDESLGVPHAPDELEPATPG